MRIRVRVLSTAVLLLACTRAAAITTENQEISPTTELAADKPDALPDLRFHVPFPVVNVHSLDLESLSTVPPDLRIKRTLVANSGDAACDANGDDVPAYPSMQASDRLLSVDGIPISLKSFQEVIDMAVGTTVVLPLFKAASDRTNSDTGGNILTGFARIEIMRPQSVEFQPTTRERVAQVQQWHEAVARKQQEQLDREQEERERKAALENDLVEKQAREKRDKDEKYRLEMTPHDRVHAKRVDGKEFRYEVVFVTKGPIGLNWDLLTTERTIVSHVEPKLAAERVGVISPKDQLIELNDVDTSEMAPQDVVQVYIQSTPPRRMVFRCSATAAAAAKAAEALGVLPPAEKVQNWTIVFESPVILSGWQTRLHLATWSKEPTEELVNKTMALAMVASPLTGCQTLPEVAKDRQPTAAYLAYRGGCSFVDKAQFAYKSNAKALIVVNNIKGDGRFPAKMPDVSHVDLAVTMIGKMDGELVMAILEHDTNVQFHLQQEDPSRVPSNLPPKPAPRLTNEEMVLRRDAKKAARALTFWYVNKSTQATVARHAQVDFRVLPALFGSNITAMPYRIVVAYPQDTACHPQGLGVLGTRAVILVKRGGCSFGTKAKSVQAVGGAGMLMINSDESLLPLMSDPKETAELTIWAASIGLSNGTFLADVVTRNKNLPSLVKIAPHVNAAVPPSTS